MKSKFIYVAVLATLGLMATGCQKENEEKMLNHSSVAVSTYVVEYTIEGESYRVVLDSEEDYNAFLLHLMALAREGYCVNIRRGGIFRQMTVSKEVVVYTTQDQADAVRWTKKMMDGGYTVNVTYDDKTNTYTCVAIK